MRKKKETTKLCDMESAELDEGTRRNSRVTYSGDAFVGMKRRGSQLD